MRPLTIQPLEDRIVFDGAIAVDVASPPTNGPDSLAVVDLSIDGVQELIDSLNSDTHVVEYTSDTDDLATLSSSINNILNGEKVESISFVTDGENGSFNLAEGSPVTEETLEDKVMINFWKGVSSHIFPDGSINILGCNVAGSSSGISLLTKLDSIIDGNGYNIDLNASDDLTGHSELGGDWILEYTSKTNYLEPLDAQSLLFNEDKIDSWEHVLDSQANVNTLIWRDLNLNGELDENEKGIPGLTVYIYNITSNNPDSEKTDEHGYAEFKVSGNNTYRLEWEIPLGSITTLPHVETDSAIDSDATTTNSGFGVSDPFFVDFNDSISTVTAGMIFEHPINGSSEISGYVWDDINGNGIQDIGELPKSDVSVNLSGQFFEISTQSFSTETLKTTQTDVNGLYNFDNIIGVGGSANIVFAIDTSQGSTSTIEWEPLVNANTDLDINLDGFSNTTLDGQLLSFNRFLNVLIDLGFGNTTNIGLVTYDNTSTVWDLNSSSSFKTSTPNQMIDPTTGDFNNQLSDSVIELILSNNAAEANYDVGVNAVIDFFDSSDLDPSYPSIMIFESASLNASVAAITIPQSIHSRALGVGTLNNLLADLTAIDATPFSAETVDETASIPNAIIAELDNFQSSLTNYQIQFEAPDDFIFSPKYQQNDSDLDSDAGSPTSGITDYIPLPFNSTDLERDAGLVPGGIIETSIWRDVNLNGTQDTNEPGLEGLEVVLWDINNNTSQTLITNSNGSVEFAVPYGGDHYFDWEIPVYHDPTSYQVGANTDIDSDGNLNLTTEAGFIRSDTFTFLQNSGNHSNIDAGMIFNGINVNGGSLTGTVWNDDLIKNGIQDAGEPTIPGVKVTLFTVEKQGNNFPPLHSIITTTDSNGEYTFTDLPEAGPTKDILAYLIHYTRPNGFDHTISGLDSLADEITGFTDNIALGPGAIGVYNAGFTETPFFNVSQTLESLTTSTHLVDGSTVFPSERIKLTIDVNHTNLVTSENAENTTVTYTIPSNVVYIEDTLQIFDGTTTFNLTDLTDNDEAHYNQNTGEITFNLGILSNIDNFRQLSFEVEVFGANNLNHAPAPLTEIFSQAQYSYLNPSTNSIITGSVQEHAIEVGSSPDLSIVEEIEDLTRADAYNPGDTIKHTFTLTNYGNIGAAAVTFTDNIDENTSFDINSLYVDNVNIAVNGSDPATFKNSLLTIWLGTGAQVGIGGTLDPQASTTIIFNTVISTDSGIVGTTITNQAEVQYIDPSPQSAPDSVSFDGIIRDFKYHNPPDFEGSIAVDPGIVKNTLGEDSKPVYDSDAHPNGTVTTSGADNFNQWYNDVDGVNEGGTRDDGTGNPAGATTLELTETSPGSGIYRYQSNAYFPIDNQFFGNQGAAHNFSFTVEFHALFLYQDGLSFTFTGDDDVFVFINRELVIDLGGVHQPLSSTIDLDTLGLTENVYYTMDIFYAERHTTGSDLTIETSLGLVTPISTRSDATSFTVNNTGDLSVVKTVQDLSGNPFFPEDLISYTITVTNTSATEAATNVIFSDPLPTGVTFNNDYDIRIDGVAQDGSSGNDRASYDPSTRVVRAFLGTGSFPPDTGGTLTASGSTVIQFQANIDQTAFGEIINTAETTYLSPNNITLENQGSASFTASALPVITIAPQGYNEGDSGTTDFIFTATVDKPNVQDITFEFSTQDGTASTLDFDYVAADSQMATILGGETEGTFTVSVNGDEKLESNEVFNLLFANPQGATLSTVSTTATINNDDSITIAIDDVSEAEGDAGTKTYTFTVNFDSGNFSDSAITVDYSTSNGTAEDENGDKDYMATSGTLTFAPGDTEKIIDVTVNGDTKLELDETFTLDLGTIGTAAGYGSNVSYNDDQGTGTIENDDSITISIDDVNETEGNSGTKAFTFTVSFDGGNISDSTITVPFSTSDGTAENENGDNDYLSTSGTLTFTPGENEKTVDVTVNGDTKLELDETFTVDLGTIGTAAGYASNVSYNDDQGTATIENDDSITIAIDSVSEKEGDAGTKTYTFTVDFNSGNISDSTITVPYSTSDGTAEDENGDNDYLSTSGVLTFNPGDTEKTIDVTVNGDTKLELDETFTVDLGDIGTAAGYENDVSYTNDQGTGTIQNDDSIRISIDDVSETEGDSGTKAFTFTVSFDGGNVSDSTITVPFSTSDGTAEDENGDNDYLSTSGTLTFTPGDNKKTIDVTVNGDTKLELDETFTVDLGTIGTTAGYENDVSYNDDQGAGTIENDDSITIAIDNVSEEEGDTGTKTYTFTVNFDSGNISDSTITVDYNTSDGTAQNENGDNDYLSTSGTLTFTPGENEKTIDVTVNGDTKLELDETFTVDLGNIGTAPGYASNVSFSNDQGTGTIENDDSIKISIDDVSETEGDTGTKAFTFTVSFEGGNVSDTEISVDYSTSDGTAENENGDNDYLSTFGTLTFTPGENLKTVDVTVNGDTKFESDETFTVDLSNIGTVAGYENNVSYGSDQGTGTIENDDQIPTVSIIQDTEVIEGNPPGSTVVPLTVFLSNPSYQDIIVTITPTPGGRPGDGYAPATSEGASPTDHDYDSTPITLVFNGDGGAPANEISEPTQVKIVEDYYYEPDEAFRMVITSSVFADQSLAGISDTNGDVEIVILNDDSPDFVIPPSDTQTIFKNFSINETVNGSLIPQPTISNVIDDETEPFLPVVDESEFEPLVEITPFTGTSQNGTVYGTFSITLTEPPTENVTINISGIDLDEDEISPKVVTFTPENWSIPQFIVITYSVTEDGNTPEVQFEIETSDPNYNGIITPNLVLPVDSTEEGSSPAP